uniref:Uncharacterized protein n=1 Tax=Oryza rufipogon TaxID=4529 RepID=A0A0E0RE42_ORYRU
MEETGDDVASLTYGVHMGPTLTHAPSRIKPGPPIKHSPPSSPAKGRRRRKREEEETHSYSNIQYLARVPAQSLRQIHSFVIGIIH